MVKEEGELSVHVSYLEIYNENLRDLLDPSPKQCKIYADSRKGVFVKNLSKVYCETFD